MSQETTQDLNSDVLASAPIEIVAELGRVVLRADELVALEPGSILTFGRPSPTRIDLRVGDHRWAAGELVNVEGQIGVRLLSVTPAPVLAAPDSSMGGADTRPR